MRIGSVRGRRKPEIACTSCLVSVDFQLHVGQGVLLALKSILSTADECAYLVTADNVFPVIELDDAIFQEAGAVLGPFVVVCQFAVSIHQRYDGFFVFQPVETTLNVGEDLFGHG